MSVHNKLHKQASLYKPPLIRGGRPLLIFRGKLSCLGLKSLLELGKSAAYQEYGETYAWKNISSTGGPSVNWNQHCFWLFNTQKCFPIPIEEFNYMHGVYNLDSKNDMQIFSREEMTSAQMGASGMWGDAKSHTTLRLYCSLAPLPHKEHPQDEPITSGGEEGVFSKSRLYRRVCDGPRCTCLFMIQFLFHTVSLSQNHLKALSLSTHDFTFLTLLPYLFSSSSWFNSSIFSFCIPSTKARARWRFPSASVTYWCQTSPRQKS